MKQTKVKKIPVKVGFKLKDGGIVYFKATKVVRVSNKLRRRKK